MSIRNTQSQKVQQYALRYDRQKWRDWVKSRNAQNVNLVDFYLGSIRSEDSVDITDEEKEFIIRELFCDAVSAGAICPSIRPDVKDLSFKLDRSSSLSHDACLIIEYVPSGAKGMAGSGVWGDRCLHLTADTACDIFGEFVWEIQDVAK